jgi:hypothetical protein
VHRGFLIRCLPAAPRRDVEAQAGPGAPTLARVTSRCGGGADPAPFLSRSGAATPVASREDGGVVHTGGRRSTRSWSSRRSYTSTWWPVCLSRGISWFQSAAALAASQPASAVHPHHPHVHGFPPSPRRPSLLCCFRALALSPGS